MMIASTTETDPADGRRLRRERNREAIIEALIAFYDEGNPDPSADDVAERAGVSARSLFRHFDDLDDLCHCAFSTQLARIDSLTRIKGFGTGDTEHKVRALVEQRTTMYEQVGNVMRIARAKALSNPVVAGHLDVNRAQLRNQMVLHLHDDLAALPARQHREIVAALDALVSFETWDTMRRDGTLPSAAVRSAIVRAVVATLTMRAAQ